MGLGRKGIDFKTLYENKGKNPQERAMRCGEMIHKLLNEEKPKLACEDFSLKELWEAVDVTGFSVITGELVSKKMIEAFKAASKVGDSLVTKFTSNKELDRVPGAYNLGTLEDLNPGQPYPHTGDIKEKYVTMSHAKRGIILDITEEAITFDQTGLILRRAAMYGELLAHDREKKLINTVMDLTDYEAYYPANVQTALYSGGNANVTDQILTDWTDINAAWILLGAMTDENGDPVDVFAGGELAMLVPNALKAQAARLRGAIMPGAANQEANPWANAYVPYASSYCDQDSAVQWYFGNFKKQFTAKVVIPLQVLRAKAGNINEWNSDVKASHKLRYDETFGSTDFRYVIKSTASA